MNLNATQLEELPDPFAVQSPCGCDQPLAADDTGALPDPALLAQELDQLLTQANAPADDLLFADVDEGGLDFERELELAGLTPEPLPPLEDILKIAERYPGLKVTFSF